VSKVDPLEIIILTALGAAVGIVLSKTGVIGAIAGALRG
jgi:hypothetical protein